MFFLCLGNLNIVFLLFFFFFFFFFLHPFLMSLTFFLRWFLVGVLLHLISIGFIFLGKARYGFTIFFFFWIGSLKRYHKHYEKIEHFDHYFHQFLPPDVFLGKWFDGTIACLYSEDNFHKRLQYLFSSPSSSPLPSLIAFASIRNATVYIQDGDLVKEIMELHPWDFPLLSPNNTEIGPPTQADFPLLSLEENNEANPPNFAQVLKKYSQTITTLLQNQEKKGKEKEDFSFHIPPEQLSHHLPSECPQNIREELSLVLSRSLKLLALHPEFQQKGKEEVREVIETGFSFSSLQKEDNPTQLFPYCFCILKETLRQFPTKKFPPLRHCPRDTVLGVKKIEKETVIQISVNNLHHNPKYWEQPSVFRPERFNKRVSPPLYPFSFFPLGDNFDQQGHLGALMGTIFIAKILENYSLEVPPNSPPAEEFMRVDSCSLIFVRSNP